MPIRKWFVKDTENPPGQAVVAAKAAPHPTHVGTLQQEIDSYIMDTEEMFTPQVKSNTERKDDT